MNGINADNKSSCGTRSKSGKVFIMVILILTAISTTFLFSQNFIQQKESAVRLVEKAKEALAFCRENGYNTNFCILIDMKIHSGKHRMFVYSFNSGGVERTSLCAHGSGKGNMKSSGSNPLFSNKSGSFLTSLGKYRLGARAYSNYGINVHYKMHGLEPTNSNAFDRIIVLHSFTPVPPEEIYPLHIPMGVSLGCPVTDNETMKYLDTKLKDTKKPVLLWIYY